MPRGRVTGTSEDALTVVEAYLQAHERPEEFFTEDGELHIVPQSEPFRGREEIGRALGTFYGGAFSDAEAERRGDLLVSGNSVVVEFIFRGRHTGSLAGEQPTGRRVKVPMIGVYHVSDSHISRARVYFDSATLARQMQPID